MLPKGGGKPSILKRAGGGVGDESSLNLFHPFREERNIGGLSLVSGLANRNDYYGAHPLKGYEENPPVKRLIQGRTP